MNENTQQHCLIDNRISSPKQATGTSLDTQKTQATNFALQRNWNIVRVISKVHSGALEHRDDFEAIINLIKESKKTSTPISHYIVTCIDRFTREGATSYENMKGRLARLGVQLHDVYGIIQPERNSLDDLGFSYKWSVYSPTDTAQIMAAEESKQERVRILNRLIRPEILLTREGYHIGPPNDGFLNDKQLVDGKLKPIQIRDPERAKYFEGLFELSARGTLTDKQIVREINAMGYVSKDTNKWKKDPLDTRIIGIRKGTPMTVKKLQEIRKRTEYAGVKCCTWTHFKPIRAQYPGLVSIDTFNQANRGKIFIRENPDVGLKILHDHKATDKQTLKRRRKHRPSFLYDKLLLCPKCSHPTFSSTSINRSGTKYPYYHCNRGHYWGVPQKEFEATVDAFLDQLIVLPERIARFKCVFLDCYTSRKDEIAARKSDIQQTVTDLEAQQASAYKDHRATASRIVKNKLEKEIEELEGKIEQAKWQSNQKTQLKKSEISYFLEHIEKILEHPKNTLKNNANPLIQEAFWQLVFKDQPTYDEIRTRTPKFGFVFAISEDLKRENPCLLPDTDYFLV